MNSSGKDETFSTKWETRAYSSYSTCLVCWPILHSLRSTRVGQQPPS